MKIDLKKAFRSVYWGFINDLLGWKFGYPSFVLYFQIFEPSPPAAFGIHTSAHAT